MIVDPMNDCCPGRYEDLYGHEYDSNSDLKVVHRCKAPEMKCKGCDGYYSTRIWYRVQEDDRVSYTMVTDCEDCGHELSGDNDYIDAAEFDTIQSLPLQAAPSWDDLD